jgi:primosomal protein N' (replication factor Y)
MRLDITLPGWRSAAANLKRRGLIALTRVPAGEALRAQIDAPPLTLEQRHAIDEISRESTAFSPIVLEGITGSGKTEVYLGVIERIIAAGRQALVLVPEIGLTPQALRRFRERLPGSIAVLHSGLAEGERMRAWLAAARGESAVVLTTPSEIYTPLLRAGLIVVDEEHDGSLAAGRAC